MTLYIELSEARFGLAHDVNHAFATKLKELLETKHLYQSVDVIDFGRAVEKYDKQILLDNAHFAFREFAAKECGVTLVPSEHELFKIENGREPGIREQRSIRATIKFSCLGINAKFADRFLSSFSSSGDCLS